MYDHNTTTKDEFLEECKSFSFFEKKRLFDYVKLWVAYLNIVVITVYVWPIIN